MGVFTWRKRVKSRGDAEVQDLTPDATEALKRSEFQNGILNAFVPGSTAAITTIEFESGAVQDLRSALERLVPKDGHYEHNQRWGNGNGFSHVRAALVKPGLAIPFQNGSLLLGAWQQLVLIDFDSRPREREVIFQVIGE